MDTTLLVSAFVVDIAVVTAAAVVVIVVVLAVVVLVAVLVAVVDCVVEGSETWFFLDQASFEKTKHLSKINEHRF